MLRDAISFLLAHPALLVVVVFGAAAIEYVFPPFWGDTLMLAGSFVAGLNPATIPAVFVAALAGSCVGAMGAWWMGRRFGKASAALLSRSERARRIAARAERLYASHGPRVLAFNRFIPGVRAFLMPLAGIGNMPGRRAFVWSSVSNVLWCSLVMVFGAVVAARSPDLGAIQSNFKTLSLWGGGVAGCLLLTLTLVQILRRRQALPAGAADVAN